MTGSVRSSTQRTDVRRVALKLLLSPNYMRSRDADRDEEGGGAHDQSSSGTREPGLSPIAWEILSYMLDNPKAADSLEGVVEWWLLERRIRRRTIEIRKALDELVSRRLVHESISPDDRSRFRINRDQLGVIKELLKNRPDS